MREIIRDELTEHVRSRGIYLLPNLFTVAALFSGFYAIVAAMRGLFDTAAIAIFIAMIMDSLDGRVARLTNTQTAFGAQLDSLSDMVSFGITPALVVYTWSLSACGKLGWLAAFVYAVATALRLARFNTQLNSNDKRYFQGLPCPAAAGLLSGMVWVCVAFGLTGWIINIAALIATVFVGVLMVSNIRYRSFKDLDLKHHVPFLTILIIVLALVLIAVDPPDVLFLTFLIYVFSGPISTILQLANIKKKRRRHKKSAV